MAETQFIVLSKKPYRESALLLSGISPDYGKLDLVSHGALKVSAKDFSVIDLYRELEIDFDESRNSELHTLKRAELAVDFSILAEQPRHYMFAGKLAAFLLRNSAPGAGLPFTYDALRSVLFQLVHPSGTSGCWTLLQCSVIFKITFLYENGLLPETVNRRQNEFLENLVAAGIENSPLPECGTEYWQTLHNWLNQLLDFHNLTR